ncbi:MAG TPA: 50S ribosomal protein L25 [Candidatus Kapabacteria bacterium]|nr:50S ribosomal protein L25 [Candidatus Kapabacteria bacterium]HYM34532.1 50S ribosomal protein L25 [Steroidobacteraceae bacterium]
MADIKLAAEPRTKLGGSTASQLRNSGRVPGVLYGHGEPSVAFHVKELDLRDLIYTNETHVVRLTLAGKEDKCILREVQFNPVSDRVSHIDFVKIHEGEKIRVDIPVTIVGLSVGVRDGGIIDHIMHKLTINVLPDKIPQHIEVDITDLKIGHGVHIRDLAKTADYTILADENAVIVACAAPKVEAEVAATPQTEVVEPEQIQAKGKKEEEGAAPAAESKEKK